jgi:hypothetical protein
VTVVSEVLTSTRSALSCAGGAAACVASAAVSTGAELVAVDSVGAAGFALVFGCLAGRAFGAAASCPGDVLASAVRAVAGERRAGVPAVFSAVAAFFAAVPVLADAALPLAVVEGEAASGLAPADLARAGAVAVVLGGDSSTDADAAPFSAVAALAALVRVEAVRAGFVAASAVLAGVDRGRAALAGEAVAASVVAAADAFAGAVGRPAGAVLDAAGRAGGVAPVDLPVESVRLVAVAFRGRVWFAATVTVGSAAVVWSRIDRSPAAVRGPAEPFVSFAMTYARVP